MQTLIHWLEGHQVTVGVIEAAAVVIVGWASGLFRLVRQRVRRPTVAVVPEGSFAAQRTLERDDIPATGTVTAYLLNVTLINPSDTRAVLRGFHFSYRCSAWRASMKQRLRCVPLPALPSIKSSAGEMVHYVWFQKLPPQDTRIDGRLDPKEMQNAWILFISATWGSHNPKIVDKRVKVRLDAILTDGRQAKDVEHIRVTDLATLEDYVPGIGDYLNEDRWWNMSVKLKK